MTAAWPPFTADTLAHLSERALPMEACGVIAAPAVAHWPCDAGLFRVAQLRNTARFATRTRRFSIDPMDWIAIETGITDAGWAIRGLWHSHPQSAAHPSDLDRAGVAALGPGARSWLFAIVGRSSGLRTAKRGFELRVYTHEEMMATRPNL